MASNSLTEALFNMYEVSVQGQPEGKAKKVPNLKSEPPYTKKKIVPFTSARFSRRCQASRNDVTM